MEAWEGEHEWEFEVTDLQIKENLSRDVLDQARELYLPTPCLNDKSKWLSDEEFLHTGAQYWILTPEAMIDLNDAIRKDKRARREVIEWWIKVIGGFVTILIGFLGVGTALVAILKK